MWRGHFSQLSEKKVVKAVSAKKTCRHKLLLHLLYRLFPTVLIKCQFFASHISVHWPTKSATWIEPYHIIRNTGDHETHDFQDFLAALRQF
jgi:hypothetical protein